MLWVRHYVDFIWAGSFIKFILSPDLTESCVSVKEWCFRCKLQSMSSEGFKVPWLPLSCASQLLKSLTTCGHKLQKHPPVVFPMLACSFTLHLRRHLVLISLSFSQAHPSVDASLLQSMTHPDKQIILWIWKRGSDAKINLGLFAPLCFLSNQSHSEAMKCSSLRTLGFRIRFVCDVTFTSRSGSRCVEAFKQLWRSRGGLLHLLIKANLAPDSSSSRSRKTVHEI